MMCQKGRCLMIPPSSISTTFLQQNSPQPSVTTSSSSLSSLLLLTPRHLKAKRMAMRRSLALRPKQPFSASLATTLAWDRLARNDQTQILHNLFHSTRVGSVWLSLSRSMTVDTECTSRALLRFFLPNVIGSSSALINIQYQYEAVLI